MCETDQGRSNSDSTSLVDAALAEFSPIGYQATQLHDDDVAAFASAALEGVPECAAEL